MNRSIHPVEREELMAYFDGELPVERAATVAAHLEQCAECTVLAADFHSVSDHLTAWQVEPSPASLAERMKATLEQPLPAPPPLVPEKKPWFTWRGARPSFTRSLALGIAGSFALLLIIAAISIPNLLRSRMAADRARQTSYGRGALDNAEPIGALPTSGTGRPVNGRVDSKDEEPAPPTGPMIVRTATIALITKDFDKARAEVEAAVRQHQGYSAQLNVTGQAGAGRALTATFRVPSSQLDGLLAELKKLGRVERESQGGDEVTQQYLDLNARLSNARNTEQRLIEVLRQRTGKVGDVLAVEQQIARVREEIERMDAQSKNLQNQVRFATLQHELREDYKAELEVAPPSTGTRIRNALVEGYRSAEETAVGILLFLLSYGPTLLVWALVLFWPARLMWRRLRHASH